MNIEEVLIAWGAWSRQGVFPEEPRCVIPFVSKPDKDDPIKVELSVLEGINRAMLMLKKRHERVYCVLAARYLYGTYDDKKIGKKIGVSGQTVRTLRREGHMFIEGVMHLA